jgi:putative ABC transport system permease protein
LATLDGVAAVDTIAFIPIRAGGEPALVLARDFPADRELPLDLRGADAATVRLGLAEGGAVFADGLARSIGARPGSRVILDTPHGPRSVVIVETITEYAGGGGALYLDRKAATRLFGPVGVHAFLVTAGPGQRDRAAAALTRFCDVHGLEVQSNEDFRQQVDDLTMALTAAVWGLLGVMFLVAAFGVGNAVAMNAWEQVPDADLLRTVGMGRRDLRRVIELQAAWLIAGGFLPGLASGLLLAVVLERAIHGLWGYQVPFRVEYELIAGVAVLELLVGVTAGIVTATTVRRQ